MHQASPKEDSDITWLYYVLVQDLENPLQRWQSCLDETFKRPVSSHLSYSSVSSVILWLRSNHLRMSAYQFPFQYEILRQKPDHAVKTVLNAAMEVADLLHKTYSSNLLNELGWQAVYPAYSSGCCLALCLGCPNILPIALRGSARFSLSTCAECLWSLQSKEIAAGRMFDMLLFICKLGSHSCQELRDTFASMHASTSNHLGHARDRMDQKVDSLDLERMLKTFCSTSEMLSFQQSPVRKHVSTLDKVNQQPTPNFYSTTSG